MHRDKLNPFPPDVKAWFPLHGKCHDHDTKTKLCFDSKLVVVVVVIGLMETRLKVVDSCQGFCKVPL